MKRPVRPSSALGWWAFWLGGAAAGWGLLFPTVIQALASAFRSRGAEPPVRIPLGMSSVTLEIALTAAALVVGVVALRRGQRAWLTLAGFALVVLIGGFWLLFALGEVLVPH